MIVGGPGRHLDSEEEYFWATTLDASTKTVTWNPLEDFKISDNIENAAANHKLCIKQILLGANHKDGETTVVEIEAPGFNATKVKVPIAVLKGGVNTHISTDILIPEAPLKITLTSGEGPVSILGTHVVADFGQSEYDDLEEEEEEDEEIAPQKANAIAANNGDKRKGKPSPGPKSKKVKTEDDE